jgi:hypothetical protein
LSAISIQDPFELTVKNEPGKPDLSPGELLQLTTGGRKKTPANWPKHLLNVAGSEPVFSIERF